MNDVTTYRALKLAESNLELGYAPRPAVEKASKVVGVNAGVLALLLLEKVLECSKCKAERDALLAHDAEIDRAVQAAPGAKRESLLRRADAAIADLARRFGGSNGQ